MMSAMCTHPKVNQKFKPFSTCIIFSSSCSCVCVCVMRMTYNYSLTKLPVCNTFSNYSHTVEYEISRTNSFCKYKFVYLGSHFLIPLILPDDHLSSLIPTTIFSLLKIPHICETMQHVPSLSNLTHTMMFLSLSILLQMQGFLPVVTGNVSM